MSTGAALQGEAWGALPGPPPRQMDWGISSRVFSRQLSLDKKQEPLPFLCPAGDKE